MSITFRKVCDAAVGFSESWFAPELLYSWSEGNTFLLPAVYVLLCFAAAMESLLASREREPQRCHRSASLLTTTLLGKLIIIQLLIAMTGVGPTVIQRLAVR